MNGLSEEIKPISETGAMRYAHRLLILAAVLLFIGSETFLIHSLVLKDGIAKSFYTMISLALPSLLPIGVGTILYSAMKNRVMRSGTNDLRWPVIRLLWTFFLFISCLSIFSVIMAFIANARK